MAYEQPWHTLTKALAADKLKLLACSAYEVNSDRISDTLECGSMFEGVSVTVPSAVGYNRTLRNLPGSNVPHIRRKAHSVVMGTHSLMFSRDQPIPMFTNNGGGWSEHNQSRLLNGAVQEEYKSEQGQGRFKSAHHLHAKGGLIGLAATGGYMAFTWPGWEQPEMELEDTLSVIQDTTGANGAVLGLVRTGYYDPEWLFEMQELLGGKLTFDQICENVVEVTDIEFVKGRGKAGASGMRTAKRQVVPVRMGWRNKVGRKDGRMMAVLDRGQVVWDRPYIRRELPCAWWQFEPELFGEWSCSLTSLVFHLAARVNELTWDADQVQRKLAHILMLGTKEQVDAAKQAKGIVGIPVDNKGRDPRFQTMPQVNQDAMGLIDRYEQWIDGDGMTERNHSTGGSGEMAASGKQEHMRASYWTELHAGASRDAVDACAIQSARRFVWAYQDMVEAGVEITRFWGPEGGNREEIRINDLNLDESRFAKSISPISEESNSPQAKLDEAKEWFQLGKLDSSGYVQLRIHLDTQAAADSILQKQAWVDGQIRLWMHTPQEKTLEPDFYQSPRRWLDLEDAADRVQNALMKAEMQGMAKDEPWRLEFFELFLDEVAYYMDLDSAQAQTSVSAKADIASIFPALAGGQPGVATNGNQSIPGGAAGLPAPSAPGAPPQLPGQLPGGSQGGGVQA